MLVKYIFFRYKHKVRTVYESHEPNNDELETSVKLFKHRSARLQTLKNQKAQYANNGECVITREFGQVIFFVEIISKYYYITAA